jgi:tripartite-type tricarboxylate transporter receptor subunit TctC
MAGRIDFTFSPIGTARPLIEAGKVAALAVSTKRRAKTLPDVPTTIESGFPNSEFDFWIGLFMPAKTPRAIVEKLGRETTKAVLSPPVQDRLAALGAEPMVMTPGEFDAYLRAQVASSGELIRKIGIKPE